MRKYQVKIRQVIHKEYTFEIEAESIVEAMDKAEDDKDKWFLPDWCYKITKSKWAPVSVTEVKKESENK